jgi:hypothetical protein
VTTTTVAAAGQQFAEASPATPIPLSVRVTSASHGGPVIITIDHYDPIYGWHFATTVAARVEPDGVLDTSWTPPSVGHWRARARFTGTLFSSFSQSDYVLIHVAEPLEISGAVPAP